MEIMSLWKSIGIRERVLGNEIKKFFLKLPCIASSRKAFNGAKKRLMLQSQCFERDDE